jgi:transposase InsO family protein
MRSYADANLCTNGILSTVRLFVNNPGGVGSWYDNAPMESFFGTLRSELVHHRLYHARDEARPDLFLYIEAFYNRRRRHSSLDYLCPEAYEQLY